MVSQALTASGAQTLLNFLIIRTYQFKCNLCLSHHKYELKHCFDEKIAQGHSRETNIAQGEAE